MEEKVYCACTFGCSMAKHQHGQKTHVVLFSHLFYSIIMGQYCIKPMVWSYIIFGSKMGYSCWMRLCCPTSEPRNKKKKKLCWLPQRCAQHPSLNIIIIIRQISPVTITHVATHHYTSCHLMQLGVCPSTVHHHPTTIFFWECQNLIYTRIYILYYIVYKKMSVTSWTSFVFFSISHLLLAYDIIIRIYVYYIIRVWKEKKS